MFKKLLLINALFFGMLMMFSSFAKANGTYTEAVIGHVIQSTVNGTNVDKSKLMEQELEKIAYNFTLQSIEVLQKYLPSILDGISADLRMKADKEYKCALLKGSKILDKQCQ